MNGDYMIGYSTLNEGFYKEDILNDEQIWQIFVKIFSVSKSIKVASYKYALIYSVLKYLKVTKKQLKFTFREIFIPFTEIYWKLIVRTGRLLINSVSGGEKVVIAIIMRLAIARLLSSQISTVIMDEPTTHLDEERRKELVDAMKNFKKESQIIPQIIVVTHHNELEDIADTLFEVNIINNVSDVQEVF